MTAVADLDTPVVTVDLEIMRDNVRRVQDLSACAERPKVGDVHGVRNGAVEVVRPPSRGGTR